MYAIDCLTNQLTKPLDKLNSVVYTLLPSVQTPLVRIITLQHG